MAKTRVTELPPDNGARIAIYDGMCEIAGSATARQRVVPADQLFEQVIGRLRILVPREVHLAGERPYFDEKLNACIEADIARRSGDGVSLGEEVPFIRYPDGKIRPYTAGLQAARERLERDDAALRRPPFDVRKLVPSLADAPRSPEFKALVSSMREHGYLKQFPISHGADGKEVVDGRARIAAAEVVGVKVVGLPKKDLPSNRLDTPLHRVMLLLAVNASRMTDEARDRVRQAVSDKTGRSWAEIDADLLFTRDWRRASAHSYAALFEVEEVPFRVGEPEPSVPITTDGRLLVGIVKVVIAAGLQDWKFEKELRPFVVEELAKTQLNSRAVSFVEISDAITGIEDMQAHRRTNKLKLHPQWDTVRQWLIDQRRARASGANASDRAAERLEPAEQHA